MKWYLLNFARRLRFGLRNPLYALKAAMRELTLADERFLASATGARPAEIRRYINEPLLQSNFLGLLRRSEKTFYNVDVVSADLYAKKVLLQYAYDHSGNGCGERRFELLSSTCAGVERERTPSFYRGGRQVLPAGWLPARLDGA